MKTKVNKTKEEINYNKVVNFENNEITVLDGVFNYGDIHNEGKVFKGATGSKFEVVSKKQYKDIMSYKNVISRLSEVEIPEQFMDYKNPAKMCYKAMKANNEIEDFMFDLSYFELWDYLREELNLSLDQAYIFNCIGGGRCFEKDFQGNINPELSEVIREYES